MGMHRDRINNGRHLGQPKLPRGQCAHHKANEGCLVLCCEKDRGIAGLRVFKHYQPSLKVGGSLLSRDLSIKCNDGWEIGREYGTNGYTPTVEARDCDQVSVQKRASSQSQGD